MTKKDKLNLKKEFRTGESKVIDKVLEHYRFETCKVKVIRLFLIGNKSVVQTCMDIGLARSTFYLWLDEILELASKWQKELKEKI
jgi:ACT domain-containing protein